MRASADWGAAMRSGARTPTQIVIYDTTTWASRVVAVGPVLGWDDVALVSVMWANNEVGTIQPIAELAQVAAERGIPLHTDAVQAVGQVPVDFAASGVAALTLTGHKLGGPVGVSRSGPGDAGRGRHGAFPPRGTAPVQGVYRAAHGATSPSWVREAVPCGAGSVCMSCVLVRREKHTRSRGFRRL